MSTDARATPGPHLVEITCWGEVNSGDVVIMEDVTYLVHRQGLRVMLTRVDPPASKYDEPLTADEVPDDLPAHRLVRSRATVAVNHLRTHLGATVVREA
jgi:hypothetical protein